MSVKQLKNKEIFEEIQRKRMLMIETAREKGLTNDETIRHSQELDRLIYEYQCLFGSTVHEKKRSRRFACKGLMFLDEEPFYFQKYEARGETVSKNLQK